MIALPDVNVLVALAWPNHVHHDQARDWFAEAHSSGWATCPITEAGFLRVSSNRRVIPDARGVGEALHVLTALRALPGHTFWIDDVSPASSPEVQFETLDGYRQITDTLLLVLAKRHDGVLVTFDRGVSKFARAQGVEVNLLGL